MAEHEKCGNFTDHDAPKYEDTLQCMRCGFCLPTCPTFALTGRERSSPRGRVALAGLRWQDRTGTVLLDEPQVLLGVEVLHGDDGAPEGLCGQAEAQWRGVVEGCRRQVALRVVHAEQQLISG